MVVTVARLTVGLGIGIGGVIIEETLPLPRGRPSAARSYWIIPIQTKRNPGIMT